MIIGCDCGIFRKLIFKFLIMIILLDIFLILFKDYKKICLKFIVSVRRMIYVIEEKVIGMVYDFYL